MRDLTGIRGRRGAIKEEIQGIKEKKGGTTQNPRS